jgi:hypothetical protein
MFLSRPHEPPCSSDFESLLRLFLVYCNTKDNPLQTSGFPIKVPKTVLAKIRLLIQILKTRMHPASQTQHELVFKNQPPLPGGVAKRELLGI